RCTQPWTWRPPGWTPNATKSPTPPSGTTEDAGTSSPGKNPNCWWPLTGTSPTPPTTPSTPGTGKGSTSTSCGSAPTATTSPPDCGSHPPAKSPNTAPHAGTATGNMPGGEPRTSTSHTGGNPGAISAGCVGS